MNNTQISHYIERFVDTYYPPVSPVKPTHSFLNIATVFETEVAHQFANESDFARLLISVYIPDHYPRNGSKEKLYTKLVEVLVAIWAKRIGLSSSIETQKSNREDIRLFDDVNLVVSDVKTFRLGRSQKAPNVKDFLKLETLASWMRRANDDYPGRHVLGGLLTYTSKHEWQTQSEVYTQCSQLKTPVVMLSYDELAFLYLCRKHFTPSAFFVLWDYATWFPESLPATYNKQLYHKAKNNAIETLLAQVPLVQKKAHLHFILTFHTSFIQIQREHCLTLLELSEKKSVRDINLMTVDELRAFAVRTKHEETCQPIKTTLDRIDRFRLD